VINDNMMVPGNVQLLHYVALQQVPHIWLILTDQPVLILYSNMKRLNICSPSDNV